MIIDVARAAHKHETYNAVGNLKTAIEFVGDVLVHYDRLHVRHVRIVHSHAIGVRAYWDRVDTVVLNAASRCFCSNYRGWKYSTFGGLKDLTPRGVLCHELGHALDTLSRHWRLAEPFKVARRLGEKPITGYAASHIEEDIAESFRVFLSNRPLLKSVAPLRARAIRQVCNDFNILR